MYARLSLLQLVPSIAEAFLAERITASHANLLARLPQQHQQPAFEECWRKDWQDKEPHLLPARHLSAWIQTNLYLSLAEAPFDREDTTLNPTAGACVTCPRRSGFNTSLFCDVQGDQCLDAPCYQGKVNAHIDREIIPHPNLVTIETSWRPVKEQRPGNISNSKFREIEAVNQDAEPPCAHSKTAIVVFGRTQERRTPYAPTSTTRCMTQPWRSSTYARPGELSATGRQGGVRRRAPATGGRGGRTP